MTRPTIKICIEQDMGYCCEWVFFRLFKRTGLIAIKLGFSPRMIAKHKSEALAQTSCPGKVNCMYCGAVKQRVQKRA